jgi:AmmeMemoRadiSam system protein B
MRLWPAVFLGAGSLVLLLVVSSAQPVAVSSAQPVAVSSAQPAVVTSARPVAVSSARPVAVSSARPAGGVSSARQVGKDQAQAAQPVSKVQEGQSSQPSSRARGDGKKPAAAIKSAPSEAGSQYYPPNPAMLRLIVQRLLSAATGNKVHGKIFGLVSPYHGFLSSGIVAAAGYKQLLPSARTVFIFAPSHQPNFSGAAIPATQSYRTPLGEVPLSAIAGKLSRQPGFAPAPKGQTHEQSIQTHEQSIEIQLPFLQQVLKQFEIVPVLIGKTDPLKLARQIIPYLTDDSLIIASSNLSEQHPYDKAASLDQKTTKAITSFDFNTLASSEASGKAAIAVLMEIARQKKWSTQLIDYENSGTTTRARKQVTGFASIAFVAGKK